MVEGTIFLYTSARENIKFGGAKIFIIKESDVSLNVECAQTWFKEEIENRTYAAKSAWESYQYAKEDAKHALEKSTEGTSDIALEALRRLRNAKDSYEVLARKVEKINEDFLMNLFESLLPPVAGAITDAEGRFSVKIPKDGKFAVACMEIQKTKETFDKLGTLELARPYFWYFYLPSGDPAGVIKVQLDRETLFGEGNPNDVTKMPLTHYKAPKAE
jgi:hypothetical protein